MRKIKRILFRVRDEPLEKNKCPCKKQGHSLPKEKDEPLSSINLANLL